jgi:hypothetical protein
MSRIVVEVAGDPDAVNAVEQVIHDAGVEIQELHTERTPDKAVVEGTMRGRKSRQEKAKKALLRLSRSYTAAVEE